MHIVSMTRFLWTQSAHMMVQSSIFRNLSNAVGQRWNAVYWMLERTDKSLKALQLNLLRNGFRLLKEAGTLVYSTCSLTHAQNEDVVDQFLAENSSAVLQEIETAKDWSCRSGRMAKTLRFDPSTSATSGLFVAKIRKLPPKEMEKNLP